MVSVNILHQERAEALERLRDTLASLAGSDTEALEQTSERAGPSLVGRDFETAAYLDQAVQVLAAQEARIADLERQTAPKKRGSRKRIGGSSSG